jgi:hypothetical protein
MVAEMSGEPVKSSDASRLLAALKSRVVEARSPNKRDGHMVRSRFMG